MQEADDNQGCAGCKNCGTRLAGRFCHTCGQQDRDLSLPFRTLLAEGFGELFAFDSRLLRTLKPLILRPGMLTTEFMLGRRARYVPPFRLYLFISILMFVMIGLSGHSFIRSGDETVDNTIGMMLPGDTSISAVVPLWVLVYLVLSLKRTYGQRWIWVGIKTGLLIAGYLLVLLATMIGALLVTALL